MFGFGTIPALIQSFVFLFLPESPRWLVEHGQEKKAEKVLQRIYGGQKEWVSYELAEITAANEDAVRDTQNNGLN